MSELIDKIYNVEKISGEQAAIVAGIENSIAAINKLRTAIDDLEKSTRKSKGSEELINNTKLLNDNVVKGGVAMKSYESELEKLRQKTEQLTTSEKAASIEIAKARLELAAATKATKDAAIADIEKEAALNDMSGSYNSLVLQLKLAQKEYKSLSDAERNSAKGGELLKKIQDTQVSLKATDATMGNYQRNVGNYSSMLEGLTPRLGGFAGTLMDIAKQAKANGKAWGEMGNDTNMGIQSMGKAPAGLGKITAGFKGLIQMVGAAGKALLANPIGFVLAGLVLIISQVKKAIDESEERTNKLTVAFARFAPVGRFIGDLFEVIADGFIAFIDGAGRAYDATMKFLNIDTKGSDQFIKAEKLKQSAILETRKLNESASKGEAIIAEQREIMADKENYNYEQRRAALKKAGETEKQLSNDREKIARLNLKSLQAEAALDDNNAAMNDKLSAAVVGLNNAKKESAALGRKLGKESERLANENRADMKAEADAEKAKNQKILESRRRLIDTQFAIQKDSQEKSLAMNAENFKRQIQDAGATGQLLKNLKAAQLIEENKIKNEWDQKKIEAEKKTADELLAIDLKRIEDVQKGIEKQTELLSAEYDKQERDLKKQYANGLISQSEYEEKLSKLKLDSLLDVNNKTIASLEKLLADSKLTDDKRAELSAKLAKLKIDNENAVTDATIKANDDQVKSDSDATAKRIEVAQALASAGAEIFGAIAEYQNQQSEAKIAAYEKELEASDATFEKEQENLDNAIMSDETRAIKQNEINEKKAAAEQIIADKIKAEKIKQAKWEKANAIAQAIISTGLAILNAALTKPFVPLGLIAAGLAATMGAVQIATIASQPIPAFEKGGITGDGLALWGEARPEVAVTPQGSVMLAEKPTISNFDAGTKIYKSVSDYENFMAKQAVNQMAFDYDKMGEKMKPANIVLDSRGLWGIVNQQNSRRTMINRRYTL